MIRRLQIENIMRACQALDGDFISQEIDDDKLVWMYMKYSSYVLTPGISELIQIVAVPFTCFYNLMEYELFVEETDYDYRNKSIDEIQGRINEWRMNNNSTVREMISRNKSELWKRRDRQERHVFDPNRYDERDEWRPEYD